MEALICFEKDWSGDYDLLSSFTKPQGHLNSNYRINKSRALGKRWYLTLRDIFRFMVAILKYSIVLGRKCVDWDRPKNCEILGTLTWSRSTTTSSLGFLSWKWQGRESLETRLKVQLLFWLESENSSVPYLAPDSFSKVDHGPPSKCVLPNSLALAFNVNMNHRNHFFTLKLKIQTLLTD